VCVTSTPSVVSRPGQRGRRPAGEPKLYDFRRPSKLNREHVRGLQIAYETFARQFTTILTSTLRVVSQVELVSVTQMAYSDYVESLPSPSFMVLTSIEPLLGTAILQIPQETAMLCIDRLLGGPGKDQQPERALTEIETELMRALSQRVVHELRYAFEGLTPVNGSVIGLESNPQFAQVATASDVMVVASFEMHAAGQEGAATLAMPFASVYPVLEAALNSKRIDKRGVAIESARTMHNRMSDVPLEVAVQFQPVTLTPNQILTLGVGDVLPLGQPTSFPLQVRAGGITFAHAVPGSKGKHLACLIVEEPVLEEGKAHS
jgi:flagellar motor switch protein FliM